jgi:8-oxo-dGTP pyrophosphatase MutT (NUDIX family)
MMKTHRKAYGFFIRYTPHGKAELLVYAAPDLTLRFPGGTVDDGEDLLDGLGRELREETGICEFKVLRKLGMHAYYKPDVRKYVERHDYLLQAIAPLPASFSFTVQSHDKDDGMVFNYHWIKCEEINQLDWEFRDSVTPTYIPEFFNPPNIQ